ncbi:Transcriptional regulator, GntR family [Alkalibacterium sp. AK22]|uniref:GntR family transcriptional regulator n=1 Tax=Alkalibacterium sp. AK22 TaxID=1229520 RepID=UPI0004513469|nr:GntR family transcriptional regulator [Alkalibacterium sp. AK22]EXJ22994.1 Transcriptional regulator, GntR family [Alkalibacterium sp. AK22]
MRRRRKVEEKAYEYIKEQIIREVWLEGKQLKEMEISRAIEVSRTPIRNAFIRLEEDGFVKIVPNKGVFVASTIIDLKGLKDRLYYLEALFQHVLYTLELNEVVICQEATQKIVSEMKETARDQSSSDFEKKEETFWQTILAHHQNNYMNESILTTLHVLYSANTETRRVFRDSRLAKLDHYEKISQLIGESNYVYARREVRILLNQLLINLIQGTD